MQCQVKFLSTLSLRRATGQNQHQRKHKDISIHALLAESDSKKYLVILGCGISIHALLAESDADMLTDDVSTGGFLSTLSLRRATSSIDDLEPSTTHFYPRSPCGERLSTMIITTCTALFLSTLSLRRATWLQLFLYYQDNNFYPRSPCGERRIHYDNYNLHCVISIHALLAESDTLI